MIVWHLDNIHTHYICCALQFYFFLKCGTKPLGNSPLIVCGISTMLITLTIGPFVLVNPARTYPRVLPASLPSVSEPDRNQGGSLVLPGLELLPVPEPLLNFELETKDGRSVIKLHKSKKDQNTFTLPGLTETKFTPGLLILFIQIVHCETGLSILETSMATPLGIRIGCNSFLLQDFPFKGSWGFRAASAFSYFKIYFLVLIRVITIMPNYAHPFV